MAAWLYYEVRRDESPESGGVFDESSFPMLTWGLLRPDQTWAAQRDAAMKPALDATPSAGVIAHCLHLQYEPVPGQCQPQRGRHALRALFDLPGDKG